jgi:hypothetical protein
VYMAAPPGAFTERSWWRVPYAEEVGWAWQRLYLIHSPDDEVVPFAGRGSLPSPGGARSSGEMRVPPGLSHYMMAPTFPQFAWRGAGCRLLGQSLGGERLWCPHGSPHHRTLLSCSRPRAALCRPPGRRRAETYARTAAYFLARLPPVLRHRGADVLEEARLRLPSEGEDRASELVSAVTGGAAGGEDALAAGRLLGSEVGRLRGNGLDRPRRFRRLGGRSRAPGQPTQQEKEPGGMHVPPAPPAFRPHLSRRFTQSIRTATT